MNANFTRRAISYVVDMLILGMIITLSLTLFSSNTKNVKRLNDEVNTINEQLLSEEITMENYIYRYADLNKELDKYNVVCNILNAIYIIFFFVYIPFFLHGQTLGMKLTKIKIVKDNDEEASINNYLLRSILGYSLGYLIITLGIIYIMPSFSYFCISSILIFLEFLLVIISTFMILYRHDRKGICDMLTGTKVIKI